MYILVLNKNFIPLANEKFDVKKKPFAFDSIPLKLSHVFFQEFFVGVCHDKSRSFSRCQPETLN